MKQAVVITALPPAGINPATEPEAAVLKENGAEKAEAAVHAERNPEAAAPEYLQGMEGMLPVLVRQKM